jgi:hypothetical protein
MQSPLLDWLADGEMQLKRRLRSLFGCCSGVLNKSGLVNILQYCTMESSLLVLELSETKIKRSISYIHLL